MATKKHDYEPSCGTSIRQAACELIAIATKNDRTATADFNGIEIKAEPAYWTPDKPDFKALADEIVSYYASESDRRHEEYIASPEYATRMAEAEAADQKRQVETTEALVGCPDKMSLRDPEGWAKSVVANSDGYGGGILHYAEQWACMMEGAMAKGETLTGCAKRLSHLADTDGITGFMYGCAVSLLSQCWEHGEELRRWHNLDTQIGTEGERANESGGTLNPALLSLG